MKKAKYLNDAEFRQAIFYALNRPAIAKLVDGGVTPYHLSAQGQILDDGTRYSAYKNYKLDAIYAACMKDENRLDDRKLLALTVQGEEAWYEDMTNISVYAGVSKMLYQEYVDLPVDTYAPGIGLGWYYSTKK